MKPIAATITLMFIITCLSVTTMYGIPSPEFHLDEWNVFTVYSKGTDPSNVNDIILTGDNFTPPYLQIVGNNQPTPAQKWLHVPIKLGKQRFGYLVNANSGHVLIRDQNTSGEQLQKVFTSPLNNTNNLWSTWLLYNGYAEIEGWKCNAKLTKEPEVTWLIDSGNNSVYYGEFHPTDDVWDPICWAIKRVQRHGKPDLFVHPQNPPEPPAPSETAFAPIGQEQTAPVTVAKAIIPCNLVSDPNPLWNMAKRVAESPWYVLHKQVYYKLNLPLCEDTTSYPSDGIDFGSPHQKEDSTYTIGFDESTASDLSHMTSISLGGKAGINIEFINCDISGETTEQWGYSEQYTKSFHTEQSKTLYYYAWTGYRTAVWEMVERFVLTRANDNTPLSHWERQTGVITYKLWRKDETVQSLRAKEKKALELTRQAAQ